MKIFSNKLSSHLIDIAIVSLMGTLVSLGFIWKFFTWPLLFENAIYSSIIGSTLWKGNEFISHVLYNKFAKKLQIATFIWLNSVSLIVYTSLNIIIVNYIWSLFFFDCFENFLTEKGFLIMGIQFFITIIITLILTTKSFYTDWLRSIRLEEQLKQERLALQYQALRNQVNPHFLFNSLNTLSSLVEVDAKSSVLFIKQLANVYRYVLDQHNRETVELSKEIDFTKSYLYLQQIRLNESIRFTFEIKDTNFLVLPLSIQMLVENCIKHNIATIAAPLTIKIQQLDGYIIVENNLQKRTLSLNESKFSDSINLGLKNLKSRYEYLTHQELLIIETKSSFVVKLPLIKE